MEPLGGYKKAAAALDEAARARLRGPFTSDSAPSPAPSRGADADDGLMDLVDEFYNGYGEHRAGVAAAAAAKDAAAARAPEWKETLRLTLADAAAARIRAEAERIVRDAGPAVVVAGGGVRKHLAERLRARGFNAG